jgi:hypothetical protein
MLNSNKMKKLKKAKMESLDKEQIKCLSNSGMNKIRGRSSLTKKQNKRELSRENSRLFCFEK